MPSSREPHSSDKSSKSKSIFAPFPFLGILSDRIKPVKKKRNPGAPPGIEHLKSVNDPPEDGEVSFSVIDLSETERKEERFDSIDELISTGRPDWSTTRWIDIQGIHPYVLKRLQEKYPIHPLSAEDALHTPQRPKVEDYDDSLFVVLRMLRFEGQQLINEQVSFFFFKDTIITVQEAKGDIWDKVRQRTCKSASRFRHYGAPYLLYALIDAIIDHVFPFLDLYFESIDLLEQEILSKPTPKAQTQIHSIKRELVYLRQAIWPMRDVIVALAKDEYELLPAEVENYFRDVQDHASQACEAIDIYRDTANGLQDLYMAASSNKMNEVMKALTIMAGLFMPLTFLAGVYGMNFEHIPEMSWEYSYPTFWVICVGSTIGLLWYFKRKGWF